MWSHRGPAVKEGSMGLLDSGSWHGKIYSNGWVDGSGADYPVTEPATGAELGRIGRATPADVRAAARTARAAQPAWAAPPYSERAAVLRRAGDLWLAHADEIKSWLSRETGAIPPLGDLQVHVSADECYEAAALASQPYGELLRTPQPQLSFARRVPAGEALITDPHVRIIAFTGSTKAGRAVAKLAGEHLKRVHLELGGNSALIVLDDVDVDQATSVGAFGSFIHQGQICMSTSRHLVHNSIAKEYASALAARAEHLPVGDPVAAQVALGPLSDERQRDNVHRIVTSSVDAGAALLTGGTYEGLFYRPTVLADVPTSAPAYAEEIFGPVAPVVGFDSIDEAVELASGTDYGLSLGILTKDVYKGLEIAERIPTGIVHINDQTVADEATIPFGGVGASGNGGRLGGARANLEAFTETQWVTVRGDLPAYPF